ncbi:MAG TPA: DedA family protein [Candidatus Thermoplasmatota archaeon]|nr:DedA family protein [Candidatus Thermoplasmatota archaeon]
MGLLGAFLAAVAEFATDLVAQAGYAGVFLLMAAESMVFPIPSEAVMPPAGILVQQGRLSFLGVALASTAGTLLGSWLSYTIGARGGIVVVRRYGKYVLLSEKHLDRAHAFFERRGFVAVLLARFVPGVRHVSSIPAGAARMPIGPFFAATALGAIPWNLFLLWSGYKLGEHWDTVVGFLDYAEYVAVAVALVALAAWLVGRRRRRSEERVQQE